MNNKVLLEKLNAKFPYAEFTGLAESGQFVAAADSAGKHGVWGVWAELREAAGLPSDDTARNELVAAVMAAKKARFNRK